MARSVTTIALITGANKGIRYETACSTRPEQPMLLPLFAGKC
jgi:hypothetical protein